MTTDRIHPEAPATLLWLDPHQAPALRALADAAGLAVTAAGTPERGGLGPVADAFAGPSHPATFDDLRSALATIEADIALLAAADDFAEELDSPDGDAIRAFRQRGGRVITFEPAPASFTRLSPDPALADLTTFCPRLRATRAVTEGLDALETFGPVRFAAIRALSRAGEGSLGARLLDAVDTLLAFIGEPDQVYAAYAPAAHARALHAQPGESLRGLHGEMTVSLAYADGRAASIVAADQAGQWSRRLSIIGESGQIDIGESAALWRAQEGEDRPDEELGFTSLVEAAAAHIRRLRDHAAPAGAASTPPLDYARTLAVAGAALLSIRTGEAESPRTIQRMAQVG